MTEDERRLINERDLELINAHADELNRQMEDLLGYQSELDDSDYENLDRQTWDLLIRVPISEEDLEP